MSSKQIAPVTTGFEALKLTNEYNAEYWSARELQPLLGYSQWRRFEQAIERAMASCEASGNKAQHHFAGAGKPITGGKGAVQLVDDFHLSRFACYLIAQNGDPRKPEIAHAQQYFAVQTRRQELSDQAVADVERIELRKQTAEEFKALSGAAQDAGVQSKMFGVFHDAGYKGLYGGLGRDAIKQRKTIPDKDTTGAVAHKMGRRWIMVEIGDHCHTHIIPRLQKVIDGQDPGGVTQATGWKGGGGFRYYELAPTLLTTDRWGNLVINPAYDAATLAAAMCRLEGFTYAPSEVLWWQQGRSSECDFIYVTTQTLGAEQLAALSDEVGADRSLLVCCGAYRGVTAAQASERWPNLTIKKIPKMVKDRCEWGHDDYSLNVANLPMAQRKVDAPAQDDFFSGSES